MKLNVSRKVMQQSTIFTFLISVLRQKICVWPFLIHVKITDKNIYVNGLISIQECAERVNSLKYYVDILLENVKLCGYFIEKNVHMSFILLSINLEILTKFMENLWSYSKHFPTNSEVFDRIHKSILIYFNFFDWS